MESFEGWTISLACVPRLIVNLLSERYDNHVLLLFTSISVFSRLQLHTSYPDFQRCSCPKHPHYAHRRIWFTMFTFSNSYWKLYKQMVFYTNFSVYALESYFGNMNFHKNGSVKSFFFCTEHNMMWQWEGHSNKNQILVLSLIKDEKTIIGMDVAQFKNAHEENEDRIKEVRHRATETS